MWLYGVFMAVLASFFGALGDVCIRLSFTKEKESASIIPLYLRPYWLLGIFCGCVLNVIFTIASLNYASANIVTPFAGLHIFLCFILGHMFLDEQITKMHIIGGILIIIGLIIVLTFGIHDYTIYNISQLMYIYRQPTFIVYSFFLSIALFMCIYIALYGVQIGGVTSDDNLNYFTYMNKGNLNSTIEKSSTHMSIFNDDSSIHLDKDKTLKINISLDVELSDSDRANGTSNNIKKLQVYFKSKLQNIHKSMPKIHLPISIIRFCMAASSGICGGNTNVLGQNIMQIFQVNGPVVLLDFRTYILILTVLIFAVLQFVFWNLSLKNFEAIFVVPIVNSVLIAVGGFCSLAVYSEDLSTSEFLFIPTHGFIFISGLVFIISGIYTLSFTNINNTNNTNTVSFDNNESSQNKEKTKIFKSLLKNGFSKYFNIYSFFNNEKIKSFTGLRYSSTSSFESCSTVSGSNNTKIDEEYQVDEFGCEYDVPNDKGSHQSGSDSFHFLKSLGAAISDHINRGTELSTFKKEEFIVNIDSFIDQENKGIRTTSEHFSIDYDDEQLKDKIDIEDIVHITSYENSNIIYEHKNHDSFELLNT